MKKILFGLLLVSSFNLTSQSNLILGTGFDLATATKFTNDFSTNDNSLLKETTSSYLRYKFNLNFERIMSERISFEYFGELNVSAPNKQTYNSYTFNNSTNQYEKVRDFEVSEYLNDFLLGYGLNIGLYGDLEEEELTIMLSLKGAIAYTWTNTKYKGSTFNTENQEGEISLYNLDYKNNFTFDIGAMVNVGVVAQYPLSEDILGFGGLKFSKYWTTFEESHFKLNRAYMLNLGVKFIIN